MDDLTPLPPWKTKWRRGRIARRKAAETLLSMVRSLVPVVVSVVGATLVALGVHQVYGPAGFITGGLMVFALQWSHEKDRSKTG